MKNIIIALLISILALSGNLYAETTENTSSETSVSQGYQGDENISGTASALMDDVWEMLEKVKAMGNKVIDMISRMGEMAEKMTDMTSRMGDVAETLEIEQDQGIESAIYLGDASDFAEEEAAQAAAAETSLPAGFFDSIFDMMVGEPIKAMSQAMAKMMEPVIDGFLGMAKKINTMASKIGLMADNILGMADKIGVMAEYILNMADRIVLVQQNMADLVTHLGGGSSSKYLGLALNGPISGTSTSSMTAPTIILSNDKVSSYTLYASNHAYFPSGGTLKMNVSDASSLQSAWEEVVKIAENNSIYIAVKGIDSNNNTSELSNSVQLNLSSL